MPQRIHHLDSLTIDQIAAGSFGFWRYTRLWRRSLRLLLPSMAGTKEKTSAHCPIRQHKENSIDFLMRIRGIQNPGAMCYCNATIVALFASPAFKERLIAEDGSLAFLARKVFDELQSSGPPLSHLEKGALKGLSKALQSVFPPIREYSTPQDASELFASLLDALFKSHPFSFSVVPCNERDRVARTVG